MKKLMRRAGLTALAAVALTATGAWADTNPANDSGQFTVRITPNVDLGVTVNTTGANWVGSANLDVAQDLGTNKLLTTPVSIAMAGNMNNQELTLTGAALNTWSLDVDEVDGLDQIGLYALFGRTAFVGSPAVGDFTATTRIATVATRAGQPQADEGGDLNHVYELPTAHAEYGAGAGDVDGMLATATRKLWLRSRTPTTTTTDLQAAFTVTVTAVSGTGN